LLIEEQEVLGLDFADLLLAPKRASNAKLAGGSNRENAKAFALEFGAKITFSGCFDGAG